MYGWLAVHVCVLVLCCEMMARCVLTRSLGTGHQYLSLVYVCVCVCADCSWWDECCLWPWADQIWPFYSCDLARERESREVTSSSSVPSNELKSVCDSSVQNCLFFYFLCHLAGTLVNKGLPFLCGKEEKSRKETIIVFSSSDINKIYILSQLLAFVIHFSSQAKQSLQKTPVSNIVVVLSFMIASTIQRYKMAKVYLFSTWLVIFILFICI